ncbi:hypothetical protein [Micromonospora sp. LOL_024]|uniref:hypothetical protein n=1 Tax=Micromonospora sp. LOL_024 TaxID=3345412 RepID=UPI003A86D979
MANKMLGKVVAGAALGGASLLVFAPGVAFADGHPDADEGKVFAKPHAVKAGEEVRLVQLCPEPQDHPFVWSKITGKVELKPADEGGDRGGRGEEGGTAESGRDWADNGGGKGRENGDAGEDWKGGDRPQPADSAGGGAADGGEDWKGEEHGQDAEGAADRKDGRGHKDDWQGHESENDGWTGEESENGGWSGEKRDWAAGEESGNGHRWEHEKDFVYYGEAHVAEDAEPGTYELDGSCGTGELVVLPHGGVDGGDGGVATGTDRGLATAGASLVGAAALGGLVLMRRRRADEFAA